MRSAGNRLIGILGGTFNPIHFGHLRLAQELADALDFDEVRFIPSANPPHKPAPTVSAQDRAEMVRLAISDNPLFKLDTRELDRAGASYTIDTLMSLREELGQASAMCLILGSDAFVKIESWHRWQELLNYAHIVLVTRVDNAQNQQKISCNLSDFLAAHYTENPLDLANKAAGYIHMQQIPALDISSTAIRERIKLAESARYLAPASVLAYIAESKLYR